MKNETPKFITVNTVQYHNVTESLSVRYGRYARNVDRPQMKRKVAWRAMNLKLRKTILSFFKIRATRITAPMSTPASINTNKNGNQIHVRF